MAKLIHAHLRINPDVEADQVELERATRSLRRELLDTNLEEVTYLGVPQAPPGAKGEAFTWGSLILTFVSGGTLPAVLGKLLEWAHPGRTVFLELGGDKLQVGGLPKAEQDELIKAFLTLHQKDGPHE